MHKRRHFEVLLGTIRSQHLCCICEALVQSDPLGKGTVPEGREVSRAYLDGSILASMRTNAIRF